ncbi:MAG: hypothetical protein QNJ97_13520 [Myxococcota bacterium]|nr:hypothetical protein [Myxococcota bacterium]
MVTHRKKNTSHHFMSRSWFLGGVLLFTAMPIQSRAEAAANQEKCSAAFCLFIEHDMTLTTEANLLAETLRLRLCKRSVAVLLSSAKPPSPPIEGPDPDRNAPIQAEAQTIPNHNGCPNGMSPATHKTDAWWVVHLTATSPEEILVAVDYLEGESDEDLIRELPKGPDPSATAWTIALMIEEVIRPYLDSKTEQTPLGAGLAIVEPPAVGGVAMPRSKRTQAIPSLRYLSAGFELAYLGVGETQISDLLAGPQASIQGLLGPRFVAAFSAGWIGTGRFDIKIPDTTERVELTVSHVPLNLMFGFAAISRARWHLTILSGLSTGFSIYRVSVASLNRQHTYMYFDPWVQARVEASYRIYGPLGVYMNGGVGVPLIREVMADSIGVEIYRQHCVLPIVGLGLQLWIEKNVSHL